MIRKAHIYYQEKLAGILSETDSVYFRMIKK